MARKTFGIGADKEITRLLPIIFDSIADGVTVLDRAGLEAAACSCYGADRQAYVSFVNEAG